MYIFSWKNSLYEGKSHKKKGKGKKKDVVT